MPEPPSIGADVVEAALTAYAPEGVAPSPRLALKMEAAIRAALEKLGLREERRDTRGDGVTLQQPLARWVSDWHPVERSGEPS